MSEQLAYLVIAALAGAVAIVSLVDLEWLRRQEHAALSEQVSRLQAENWKLGTELERAQNKLRHMEHKHGEQTHE